MTQDYPALSHIPLQAGATYARPPEMPRLVHRDDPAAEVMTDFATVVPVTVDPEASIDAALAKMKSAGVRLLLVVSAERHVLGVISADDIQGDRPIKFSQENRVSHDQIRVAHVMTPQSELEVLNYLSIGNAQVGHIESTLRAIGRQHGVVVEVVDGRQQVRGLFSSTAIAKRLGEAAGRGPGAKASLAEIVHELG